MPLVILPLFPGKTSIPTWEEWVVVFTVKKFAGPFHLLTQLLAAAIWIWFLVNMLGAIRGVFQEAQRAGYVSNFGLGVLLTMALWMFCGAAGTLYWFVRQFYHAAANRRLAEWLRVNAERIRNNEPVYYRCKRITLKTVLVRYDLICSVVFLSGRMRTRWLVLGQEPKLRHALGASLYSFWNGWWGIPFGVIWTPIAIAKNISGTSTALVEDLIRVPPPPAPLPSMALAFVAGIKEANRELLLMD